MISTHLPTALRTFLLTLAVVDDLLAITVIALFYSNDLHLQWLLLALLPLGRVHAAGAARDQSLVPAAAAGVCHLGAGARLRGARHRRRGAAGFRGPGATAQGTRTIRRRRGWPSTSSTWSGRCPPASRSRFSRFFSAGVLLGGWAGLQSALSDPIAIGIIAGLVVGKPIGILIATYAHLQDHPPAACRRA